MLKELKEKLDQQYFEMWPEMLPTKENGKLDWIEIIGAPIVAILIFVFAYLYFRYV